MNHSNLFFSHPGKEIGIGWLVMLLILSGLELQLPTKHSEKRVKQLDFKAETEQTYFMTSAPKGQDGPPIPRIQRLTLRAFPTGWTRWEKGLLAALLLAIGTIALSYLRFRTLSLWLRDMELLPQPEKQAYLWPLQLLVQGGKLRHSLQIAQERRDNCEIRVDQIGRTVAGMSHDLKAPIGALLGYAEILDREAKQISPLVIRRYAQAMLSLGDRLHRLVQDLTEFVRLKSLPPTQMQEVFSLSELVAENFELFRGQFQEQGLKVHLSLPSAMCLVEGNVALLERALQNLLRNALQHNLPDGFLKVTLSQHPEKTVLQLSNPGPPIPPDVLENLNRKHPKGSNSSQKGNGLGLLIVQEIVHLHGAQMQIESPEGQPVNITLSFPNWQSSA